VPGIDAGKLRGGTDGLGLAGAFRMDVLSVVADGGNRIEVGFGVGEVDSGC